MTFGFFYNPITKLGNHLMHVATVQIQLFREWLSVGLRSSPKQYKFFFFRIKTPKSNMSLKFTTTRL